jgi:hypothetical protein
MKIKIVIDPSSRILYSSYYIKGLYEVFGRKNVSFSSQYFADLKRREESHSFDHYMAFVMIDNQKNMYKYIIDFRDKTSIKESAYIWCNKYAKINYNKVLTEERYHEKVMSIPPGFGIKIWSSIETAKICFFNLLHCKFKPLKGIRSHIGDYRMQYKRPKIEEFTSDTKIENVNFVFMIGTLWAHKNSVQGVNLLRKAFVKVCQESSFTFEGGFFANNSHPNYDEYKDVVFNKRYTIKEYLTKTKQSVVVFNTPSVHNCHGWKLGECLAMGKAIISTAISNDLPERLVHGKNLHIISTTTDLNSALEKILNDSDYRLMLEYNAKEYYNKHVNPSQVIKSIVLNGESQNI